jgi:hypothetical protein
MPQTRGGAIQRKECSTMNRISGYALALALGLSVTSTAAFAADASPQPAQTANAQYAQGQSQGPTSMPGPYWQLEQGPYAQVGPYDRPSEYIGGGI